MTVQIFIYQKGEREGKSENCEKERERESGFIVKHMEFESTEKKLSLHS